MTQEDRPLVDRIERLNRCSMLPGSYDKQFSKSLRGKAELSSRQLEELERLEHRYRKQLANQKKVLVTQEIHARLQTQIRYLTSPQSTTYIVVETESVDLLRERHWDLGRIDAREWTAIGITWDQAVALAEADA